MIPTFNIYATPPTVEQLELERKYYFRMQRVYVVTLVGSIVLFGMAFNQRVFTEMPDSWLASSWVLLFAIAAVLFSLWKLIKLGTQMLRLQETGKETLDAINCAEIPLVTAYCKAVNEQARVLTKEEAEGLMAACTSPEAIKKIAAAYDRYDEAHPRRVAIDVRNY